MRSEDDRIEDILEAIDKIDKFKPASLDQLGRDEMVYVWVIHHLQIIGEAASKLPELIKKKYPTINWSQIITLRNIVVHEYFGIEPKEIWNTITYDLPLLKQTLS